MMSNMRKLITIIEESTSPVRLEQMSKWLIINTYDGRCDLFDSKEKAYYEINQLLFDSLDACYYTYDGYWQDKDDQYFVCEVKPKSIGDITDDSSSEWVVTDYRKFEIFGNKKEAYKRIQDINASVDMDDRYLISEVKSKSVLVITHDDDDDEHYTLKNSTLELQSVEGKTEATFSFETLKAKKEAKAKEEAKANEKPTKTDKPSSKYLSLDIAYYEILEEADAEIQRANLEGPEDAEYYDEWIEDGQHEWVDSEHELMVYYDITDKYYEKGKIDENTYEQLRQKFYKMILSRS